MLAVAFILFLAAAAYPIAGYPLLALLLARLRPRRWSEAPFAGSVAHVITVFNEEQRVGPKLENTVALQPPPGGLRTVVVDDGSTDRTREIVAGFRDRGIELIACPRRGKERAQQDAIRRVAADVIVFSDAAAAIAPEAIELLVRPFSDPEVAAVSGTDSLPSSASGEDLYVRFEMRLRESESLVGSLVGLSGCFFAVRRSIAEQLSEDVPSDMAAALLAILSGRRAVAGTRARCTYAATPSLQREFARKRRTVLRGLRCLWRYRRAMTSRPVVAWQVWSHKCCRFLVPWWLLAAAGTAAIAALRGQAWGRGVVAAAGVAAAVAAAAVAFGRIREFAPARAVGFLVVSNAAVIAAWVDWLLGRRSLTWMPTARG
jgi:cellulose synthase/poly-beta-1,6-N-acetylglucosamine synthase-like glycosyltransferase